MTMTLLEFCDEFRISHAKAKRMQKRGVLLLNDIGDLDLVKIRQTFRQSNDLRADILCALLESPSLVLQLGRYSGKAQDALDDIGDAIAGQAPREVALSLMDAANGDEAAIKSLCDWIKGALPKDGSPVGYHWLAVRLMLPLPANIRHHENERIRRALLRCRKSGALDGWFTYEHKSGRNVTIYARPKISLVDLDL
jgi:hypothetical protein